MPKKTKDVGCEATPLLKDVRELMDTLAKSLPCIKVKNIKAFYEDYLESLKPPPPPPPPPPVKSESFSFEATENVDDIIEEDEEEVKPPARMRRQRKDGCCNSQCEVTCKKTKKPKKPDDPEKQLQDWLRTSYKNTINTQEYYTPDCYRVKETPVLPVKQTENGRTKQCVGPAGGEKKCKVRSEKMRDLFGIQQIKKLFPVLVRIMDTESEQKVKPEDFFAYIMESGLHPSFTLNKSIKLLDKLYEVREERELSIDELMFAIQKPTTYLKKTVKSKYCREATLDKWGTKFDWFGKPEDPPNYVKKRVENEKLAKYHAKQKEKKKMVDRTPRFDSTLRRASGAAALHHHIESFKMGPDVPAQVNMMRQFLRFKKEMDDTEWLRDKQDHPYAANNNLREMAELQRLKDIYEGKVVKDRERKRRNYRNVYDPPGMKGCGCYHGGGSKKTACHTRNKLKDQLMKGGYDL